MDWGTLTTGVVTAGIGAAAVVYTNRVSKRIPNAKVGDAYSRVIAINKEAVDDLETRVRGMRGEMDTERRKTDELQTELSTVRALLFSERRKVDRLIDVLRANQIPIPEDIG